jgi:putative membrane protein
MGYGWSDGGMGIGTWVLMALVMILLWGGVVAFVIYLVQRCRPIMTLSGS